ncbi:MAG: GAF domain-containing protein [Bacteroidota bacterium]
MKPGFGIRERLFMIIAIAIFFIYFSLNHLLNEISERDQLIKVLTENYQTSISYLEKLEDKLEESQKTFSYLLVSSEENKEMVKDELELIHNQAIPSLNDSLISMSYHWPEEDRLLIKSTRYLLSDSLYFRLLDIADLNIFNEPGTAINHESLEPVLKESGIIFLISEIEQNLNYLLDKRKQEVARIQEGISAKTRDLRKLIIILSLFSGFILILATIYLFLHLRKSIKKMTSNLESLAKGVIPQKIKMSERSEFSGLARNINSLSDYLRNLAEGANKIAEKDFTESFEALSDKDLPGNAILQLQESLKNAHQKEEKFKKKKEERSWKSESIAVINDVLRKGTDNLEELGFRLVKEMVRLLNASAGGIFILQGEEEPGIELLAAYAFDRKKYLKKRFAPGEGLIGQCLRENEMVYLSDIPEDHIKIITGLGESKPVSILIVPLTLNDKVLGAIEIASLHEIENHKINFAKEIGENIAATISNVQTHIRTSYLLEQTRQQAEDMLSQEEEMRQNMEELKATQEQFAEREKELLKAIDELKKRETSL